MTRPRPRTKTRSRRLLPTTTAAKIAALSSLIVLFAFAAAAPTESSPGLVAVVDSETTAGRGRRGTERNEDGRDEGGTLPTAPLDVEEQRRTAFGVVDDGIFDDVVGAIGPISHRSLGKNKRRKHNPDPPTIIRDGVGRAETGDGDGGTEDACATNSKKKNCFKDKSCKWVGDGKDGLCETILGDGSPEERDDGGTNPGAGDGEDCPGHTKMKNCFKDENCEWVGKGKHGSCKAILRIVVQSRKAMYEIGEGVVCDFINPQAQSGDWIGLYDNAAEVDGMVPEVERAADWMMACGTKSCVEAPTSGAISFPPLPDGSNGMYKCFLLRGDPRSGGTVVASGRRQQAQASNFPVMGRSSAFEVLTADAPASPAPSSSPSTAPSSSPSGSPSSSPSASPSARPSGGPSSSPSADPSGAPSAEPTPPGTAGPTESREPTARPVAGPTDAPSSSPSATPTAQRSPSVTLSREPTGSPDTSPTDAHSDAPSSSPSATPTAHPSASPSAVPSGGPSASPTAAPSGNKSALPSASPTGEPSASPTASPTGEPSASPTAAPSGKPSSSPTAVPSGEPSASPSSAPSGKPSSSPTANPTDSPSDDPSASPISDSVQSTYVPGDLTVEENNLYLSTGLKSRIVASVEQHVILTGLPLNSDGTYQRSDKTFHIDPDGGAVIEHPDGNGRYAYVSNVEESAGGVGALYFNAEGDVTAYDMILTGTSYNCGGGLSPWPRKTWLTCEEHSSGQVWEVDPWSKQSQETKMGKLPRSVDSDRGDKYEAVAYDPDTRDPQGKYRFFITTDSSDGQLIRWTPDGNALATARASGNYWDVLGTRGTQEYLIVTPDHEGANTGTFQWSDDLDAGRLSAKDHFGYNEGIDVNDGMLYFTCKILKRLFILDLDRGNYTWSSTESGAFNSQPDQVARIVGQDGLLYFCEDGGGSCGVHARDGSSGAFYTILEAVKYGPDNRYTDIYGTETTGLAFSPDKKKMIVSFQCCHIYEIWREDGLPFDGPVLNIKYHQEAGPLSIYRHSGVMTFSNALHKDTDDEEDGIRKESARSAIKRRRRT